MTMLMTLVLIFWLLFPFWAVVEMGYQRQRAKIAEADRDWWKKTAQIVGQSLEDEPDYPAIREQFDAHREATR